MSLIFININLHKYYKGLQLISSHIIKNLIYKFYVGIHPQKKIKNTK